MTEVDDAAQALTDVLRSVVTKPEKVSVEVTSAGKDTFILNVFCAQDDLTHFTGMQNRTEQSLGILLNAIGLNYRCKLSLCVFGV